MECHGPQILFAGHVSLDIIPDMSRIVDGFQVFQPNRLIFVDGVKFSTGGAVLNTGLAAHRLGVGVRLLVHMGSDGLGKILLELARDGIGESDSNSNDENISELILIEKMNANTSFTLVLNPHNADRMFMSYPGTNSTFFTTDITDHQLDGIQVLHFGYPPLLEQVYLDGGKSLALLFKKVQERGIITSLDMCMPNSAATSGGVEWSSFFKEVLPYVDVFMPSIEEAMLIANSDQAENVPMNGQEASLIEADIVDLAHTFLDMGARIVGIKLGDQGLYLQTGKIRNEDKDHFRWNFRQLYIPCFWVDVGGTTGAGDSTIAGFLSGLVHELSIEECLIQSVATGACSVEQLDATSGILSWSDMQNRLNGGWVQRSPITALQQWRFEGNIYFGPMDQKNCR